MPKYTDVEKKITELEAKHEKMLDDSAMVIRKGPKPMMKHLAELSKLEQKIAALKRQRGCS